MLLETVPWVHTDNYEHRFMNALQQKERPKHKHCNYYRLLFSLILSVFV